MLHYLSRIIIIHLVSYLMSFSKYQNYSLYIIKLRFLTCNTLSLLAIAVARYCIPLRKPHLTLKEVIFLISFFLSKLKHIGCFYNRLVSSLVIRCFSRLHRKYCSFIKYQAYRTEALPLLSRLLYNIKHIGRYWVRLVSSRVSRSLF